MAAGQASNIALEPVRLSDVDLFSEWETGLGWDIESTQLSAGANEIGFDHFAFPELLVGQFSSLQSMKNVFAVPDGMVVLVIPRTKLSVVWCGRHLSPTLMCIIRSGRENWSVVPPGWDCYELMVAEDLIRQTEVFPPWFFEETARFERAFLPLVEPFTSRFVQRMDGFFAQGRGNGTRAVPVHGTELHETLLDALHELVDAGLRALGSTRPPRPARRPDLVMKAREFVTAHLLDDFTTDEMAQALRVSRRALSYAFKDALGVGPYEYILTERLHAVRRQLKTSDVSVTEACIAHGFNTPSRFARQYARLFGELPSATRSRGLRRAG